MSYWDKFGGHSCSLAKIEHRTN
uniref:Uncharacterized protein n=1 Tax=Vitis vinifera TaxID=29760 RepID=F6HFV6_VITVI